MKNKKEISYLSRHLFRQSFVGGGQFSHQITPYRVFTILSKIDPIRLKCLKLDYHYFFGYTSKSFWTICPLPYCCCCYSAAWLMLPPPPPHTHTLSFLSSNFRVDCFIVSIYSSPVKCCLELQQVNFLISCFYY